MDIGAPEIIIVLLVIVILFGAKKLPELARSLGRSSSEFKKGMREGAADDRPIPDPRTEPNADAGPVGDASSEPRAEDKPG
ncbi:MAG TPA: twin-arginine translocase TatA/TatE family subunit [Actinomycetota bacterium]|jgi:sec-independent protein translocase protein TatA|nr:twin-arginine translocase TatA/TatE family subunit [Actinomycetota bacterium]